MKLVFGKGKVSREQVEADAERELEALIASSETPPAIDWSVYGIETDLAEHAAVTADPAPVQAPELEEPPAAAPAPRRANGQSRPKPARRTTATTARKRTTSGARAKAPARSSTTRKPRTTKPS